jgi:hypothetical protein
VKVTCNNPSNAARENLLLDHKGHIKLTDFGFSKELKGESATTLCGELLVTEASKLLDSLTAKGPKNLFDNQERNRFLLKMVHQWDTHVMFHAPAS